MTQTGRPLGGLPLLERPMGRRAFLRSCIAGAAALVGTASLAGCSGIEGFLEPPAVSQASYRVGIDCAHPAYEMLVDPSVDRSLPLENRDYNVSGFDAFFLSRVSEGLGCRPRMVDVDHADLADYLKRGYIDVAVSSVFNGSRDTGITFSDPYAAVDLAVVCRADSRFAGATYLEALEGARMAARSDTDLDRAISQVPGAVHVPPYGSRTYPCLKVVSGEIDATVVDRRGFEQCAGVFPELVVAPIPPAQCPRADEGSLRIAVRHDDTAFLDSLNRVIAGITDEDASQMWRDAKEVSPRTLLEV